MFLTLRKPNLSSPKLNRLLIAIFVIGFVLSSAYFISAQEDTRPDRSNLQQGERGQRGEGGRRQFNPEQMAERQTERAIEDLNLSDEETSILVPKIKAALKTFKAQQAARNTTAKALEKDLVELLTVRQEAQLTIAGIVNSDGGGFGGFGGRRGRAGGGEGRRGNRPDRPQGNQ